MILQLAMLIVAGAAFGLGFGWVQSRMRRG